MANIDKTINYIELPLKELDATKTFYGTLFDWQFQDWGPSYISFSGAGIDGGFNGEASASDPGVLVVLFADDLEATEVAIRAAGGEIVQPIYTFPGGRRFHFRDPNGNELAVWSDR